MPLKSDYAVYCYNYSNAREGLRDIGKTDRCLSLIVDHGLTHVVKVHHNAIPHSFFLQKRPSQLNFLLLLTELYRLRRPHISGTLPALGLSKGGSNGALIVDIVQIFVLSRTNRR